MTVRIFLEDVNVSFQTKSSVKIYVIRSTRGLLEDVIHTILIDAKCLHYFRV